MNALQLIPLGAFAGAYVLKIYGYPFYATLLGLFAAEISLWIAYLFVYARYLSPLRHLPITKTDGSFFLARASGQEAEFLRKLNETPNDGLIRFGWLGQFVYVASPKAMSEVLVTRSYDWAKPSEVVALVGRLVGFGVLISEGNDHRYQRKHLMPAFSFRYVKELYPRFWSKAAEFMDVLAKYAEKQEPVAPVLEPDTVSPEVLADQKLPRSKPVVIDMANWTQRMTLDVIGLQALGVNFNSIENEDSEIVKQYKKVLDPKIGHMIITMLSKVFPEPIMKWIPIPLNWEIDRAKANLRNVCLEVIRRKQKLSGSAKDSILDLALESNAFEEENLIDQLLTFLAAGQDSSAQALLFAVYHLAKEPLLQAQLRAAVNELPKLSEEIDAATIEAVPLLRAFCHEVLRFRPPVHVVYRENPETTTVLGYTFPPKVQLLIAPCVFNVDPKLWGPDAGEFKPERWLKDNSGGALTNFANLTFLHGPRGCIGRDFARGEFTVLVAALVRRFEFRALDPTKEMKTWGIVARPVDGMKVQMRVLY